MEMICSVKYVDMGGYTLCDDVTITMEDIKNICQRRLEEKNGLIEIKGDIDMSVRL